MANVGFRIYRNETLAAPELIEAMRQLPVAVIADEMSRRACMSTSVASINSRPMIGTAITVKTRPGDNLVLHRALDMAGPGYVIVVDGRGELSNALAGELMMSRAETRGISGIVIDGAMRDREAIEQLSIPIFAAGIQPNGPYKSGPGEINVPISCGGVVVNPGDIVVGDLDGLVIVSPIDAPAIVERAKRRHENEERSKLAIRSGTQDRSAYSEDSLRRLGCEVFEETWSQYLAGVSNRSTP